MVLFNELKISEDGKTLTVDLSIADSEYSLNHVYIHDKYYEGMAYDQNCLIDYEVEGSNKSKFNCQYTDTKPLDSIYFVFVEYLDSSSTKYYEVGVVFYDYNLYDELMSYIKEINKTCAYPKKFIDTYIRLQALKLSCATGHYQEADELYNKYFKRKPYLYDPKIN